MSELKTIRDVMDRVVACETEEDAEALLVELERGGSPRHEALHNIGYCSGYCSRTEAARVCRIFKTAHPVFGTAAP